MDFYIERSSLRYQQQQQQSNALWTFGLLIKIIVIITFAFTASIKKGMLNNFRYFSIELRPSRKLLLKEAIHEHVELRQSMIMGN